MNLSPFLTLSSTITIFWVKTEGRHVLTEIELAMTSCTSMYARKMSVYVLCEDPCCPWLIEHSPFGDMVKHPKQGPGCRSKVLSKPSGISLYTQYSFAFSFLQPFQISIPAHHLFSILPPCLVLHAFKMNSLSHARPQTSASVFPPPEGPLSPACQLSFSSYITIRIP